MSHETPFDYIRRVYEEAGLGLHLTAKENMELDQLYSLALKFNDFWMTKKRQAFLEGCEKKLREVA